VRRRLPSLYATTVAPMECFTTSARRSIEITALKKDHSRRISPCACRHNAGDNAQFSDLGLRIHNGWSLAPLSYPMAFLAVISYTLLTRLHSVMHVVLLYHLKMSQVLQRLHMLRCGRPQVRDKCPSTCWRLLRMAQGIYVLVT